jgi:hypothetical protein
MSNSPSKPSVPTRTQTGDAEFNWPPTDEELAQCFYIAAPDKEVAPGAAECVAIDSSTALESSAGPLETPPAASTPEQSEVPGADCSGLDDPTMSDIAAARHEPSLERTTRGDWAAEIAQLQALIEALTENVEWRIPDATRR